MRLMNTAYASHISKADTVGVLRSFKCDNEVNTAVAAPTAFSENRSRSDSDSEELLKTISEIVMGTFQDIHETFSNYLHCSA